MKVKWGVIGAGGIARRRTIPEGIVPAKNAQLVAVMDVVEKAAREVADQYGVPGYTDENALLADKNVEAVYIATPADRHLAQFRKAVKAGKHVLIEKPLAHTLRDAQAVARIAAKARVKCAEGYMMKFHPLHQKARDLVKAGKLGKPVFVRGQLSCWYPPIKGAWRQIPEQGGGGSLIDMATHIFDLFEFILGSRIVQVSALCENVVHRKYKVEDSATTLLRFANGCQGVVDTFFNIPDECCLRVMEVFGSRGAILAEGTIGQGGGTMKANLLGATGGYDASQKRAKEVSGFQPVEPGEFNMYRAEIEALSDAILKKKPVRINTIANGLRIIRIAHAAYASATTGKAVKV